MVIGELKIESSRKVKGNPFYGDFKGVKWEKLDR